MAVGAPSFKPLPQPEPLNPNFPETLETKTTNRNSILTCYVCFRTPPRIEHMVPYKGHAGIIFFNLFGVLKPIVDKALGFRVEDGRGNGWNIALNPKP